MDKKFELNFSALGESHDPIGLIQHSCKKSNCVEIAGSVLEEILEFLFLMLAVDSEPKLNISKFKTDNLLQVTYSLRLAILNIAGNT